MDLSLLGKALKLEIVDKKDSHDFTQKLDFNSFSNYFLKPAFQKPKIIPHELGNSMTIFIVNCKGEKKEMKCSPNDKVKWIKENYEQDQYCIFRFDGEVMKDSNTLEYYDVKDDDVISSKGLSPGGGCNEFYLSDDLLDPSYDYDFTSINDGNNKYYRGGLEYKRPCGWKRYALKVSGKFENDLWLGNSGITNNDSEWAVSYHGTKQIFADSICKTGLHPGHTNAYGVGVYCTPNIDTAADYSEKFRGSDGKEYKLVFQNRVKPSAIRRASDKGGPNDYWYIERSEDIRPYSICVKKI